MMKNFLPLSAILAYLHMAGALQCYNCVASQNDDMKNCLNIDGTVTVESCTDDYPICFEAGVNHVYENITTYSNQRGCAIKTICNLINQDYKGNVRKCRLCSSDKCNNSTLSGN
ncbi:hypothetical protein HHI36_012219 [Cryptolaemus montrouzieri]|uniref:Protein quiver n=1 Tax=Cryptolaemus montrouzieri TaxID=559131 RepID=A0ABD2NDW8_9CUCU